MRAIRVTGEFSDLYRRAAAATRAGSKSFYFATRFFPPEMAESAHAVYWFCRYTDDLVDECGNQAQGQRDLDAWEAALRKAASGDSEPEHPVLRLFVETVRKHEIPFEYAFELIEGVRMDLSGTRYETFEDLRVFCYRVASVVGLMMCSVIGFEDSGNRAAAIPRAIDLGIAMQLTNILRDVREDSQRGRVYLPAAEMREFGYSAEQLDARIHNPAFEELMDFQAQRAESYYEAGNAGIGLLRQEGRFAVKIASDVYREILRRLMASRYPVFAERAVVPARVKYWITAKNLAGPVVRQAGRALWRSRV